MSELDNESLKNSIETFKDEDSKFKIALEIADGDREVAKKLVSGEIKDIAIIKGNFIEKSLQMYGLYIFYIDLKNKLIDRIFTTIAFNPSYASISPFLNWQEFESKLIEFEWSGNNMSAQSVELKKNINSYLNYEYMDKMIDAVNNNDEKKLKDLMFQIISKSLQINSFTNEISLELINKFYLQIAGSKLSREDKENQRKIDDDLKEQQIEDEKQKLIKENEIILDGSLEISPIRGINLTKLTEGQKILVKLDDNSPQQKYYIDILGAKSGKKILPVVATVRGVMYDESFGYFVIAEIKEGLVVRCIEQTAVNVKTPELYEKEKKSKILRNVAILFGILTFILFVLYIYLF